MDLLEPSVAELSSKCLVSFERCLAGPSIQIKRQETKNNTTDIGNSPVNIDQHEYATSHSMSNDAPLTYRLADFNLWVDGTGALASHKASLDWRLKDRPIDLTLVKGNLVMLHQFTEDYGGLPGSRSSLDEALRNIDSSLSNLSLLAVAIRQTGKKARLYKADSRFNSEEHTDLKEHLSCIVALRPSEEGCTHEGYKMRADDLSNIQQRLIQANLRRRNRFKQAQKHSSGLKAKNVEFLPQSAYSGKSAQPGPDISNPLVSGTAVPSFTNVLDAKIETVHGSKHAPTLSGTSASVPSGNLIYVQPGHKTSEASAPITEITRIAASAQYPRPRLPKTGHQCIFVDDEVARDQGILDDDEGAWTEINFADEQGDESGVAETDISPLSQRTLFSLSDPADTIPPHEDTVPRISGEQVNKQWFEPVGQGVKPRGAVLGPGSADGSSDQQVGILRRSRDWMLRTFFAREVDITMIGLEGCGKTSLLRVLAGGEFTIDSIPTVGFNMKRIQRGNITIKCWDLGGQPRFRSMWERYCRGVNCIIFVVDISDVSLMPLAKEELHDLMSRGSLNGIPLLVLGNHSERPDTLSVDELIEQLDLKALKNRPVSCYGISAKEETNLDAVVEFITRYAR
ncbi:hypothetical protein FHETE_2351 [Fusarium heterosporum]|uniref:Uncharacterized protein n=1 Tax=Fusarium heterosporum TaxID=42747 RepID=A0A8H5TUK6_FUSHE|nr:hypothetical protein FHETE_2351 [Fusarium heterosporum]